MNRAGEGITRAGCGSKGCSIKKMIFNAASSFN